MDTLFQKKWATPFHLVVVFPILSFCAGIAHTVCVHQKNGLYHFPTRCFAINEHSRCSKSISPTAPYLSTFLCIEPSALSVGVLLYPGTFLAAFGWGLKSIHSARMLIQSDMGKGLWTGDMKYAFVRQNKCEL